MSSPFVHAVRLVALALLGVIASGLPATAAETAPAPALCPRPPALLDPPPLAAAIVRALREAHRLRIVALGSSSTEGTGASRPEFAWPARLEAILDARFPADEVEIVNRGKGGETAAQNLARLERDVIALAPDLVIWQVGTNDALQGLEPEEVAARVREGIRKLRALGIEVVLMDSQWLPDPARDERVERMSAVLAGVAFEEGVAIFPRHELMEAWVETGTLPADALIGPDGLHMTDESYRCIAERLADLFPPALADEEAVADGRR